MCIRPISSNASKLCSTHILSDSMVLWSCPLSVQQWITPYSTYNNRSSIRGSLPEAVYLMDVTVWGMRGYHCWYPSVIHYQLLAFQVFAFRYGYRCSTGWGVYDSLTRSYTANLRRGWTISAWRTLCPISNCQRNQSRIW